MAEVSEHPPAPLEWHPAYRDKTWLLDWLDGKPGYPHDTLILPKPQRMTASFAAAEEPLAPALPTYTLTRRRCAGPAPYVGRPFVYHWWAAVDEFGRAIAADSTRQYNPDDEFRRNWPDPLAVPLRDGGEAHLPAAAPCDICGDTGTDYLGRPCRRCSR